MRHDVEQERNIGLHSAHTILLQRALHPQGRILESAGVGRDFHQQGIIKGCDDGPRRGRAAVQPQTRSARRAIVRDSPVIGGEVVGGVLRRDPALDGMPLCLDRLLAGNADVRIGQLASLRDQDLALDNIDAGDDFRDGVLDLESGIDLDEEERAVLVVDQKLDGAGVLVADLTADRQRRLADRVAYECVDVGGRGNLDDLLVPALDRAIALVEVDQVAMLVAQKLHLDVLGAANELFEKYVRAAEGVLSLAARLVERGVQRIGAFHDPHAAAAAAQRRLDNHRVAQRLGRLMRPRAGLHRRVAAGKDGHAGLASQVPCRYLVTQQIEQLRRRTDKHDPRPRAGPGEPRVLGEEAISGVNRVNLLLLRSATIAGMSR